MGTMTMLMTMLTRLGSRTVPTSRASADENSAASSTTTISSGHWWKSIVGACPRAWMTMTRGNTMAAAKMAWIAPAMIFSIASTQTGIGARTRSSISRVYESSSTSGAVTAVRPWNKMADATMPGTRIVENDEAALDVLDVAPNKLPSPGPPLSFGRTTANTNTNSTGWTVT